tara:strand:+ start:468 stop:983 length:516 start_codon:yes stop_codon:yes gene_type:complete
MKLTGYMYFFYQTNTKGLKCEFKNTTRQKDHMDFARVTDVMAYISANMTSFDKKLQIFRIPFNGDWQSLAAQVRNGMPANSAYRGQAQYKRVLARNFQDKFINSIETLALASQEYMRFSFTKGFSNREIYRADIFKEICLDSLRNKQNLDDKALDEYMDIASKIASKVFDQ